MLVLVLGVALASLFAIVGVRLATRFNLGQHLLELWSSVMDDGSSNRRPRRRKGGSSSKKRRGGGRNQRYAKVDAADYADEDEDEEMAAPNAVYEIEDADDQDGGLDDDPEEDRGGNRQRLD